MVVAPSEVDRPTAKRSWAPFAAQTVLVVVGVYVVVESLRLRLMTALGPGPGLFPLTLGALLILLSLIWAVQEMRSPTERGEVPERSQALSVVFSLSILGAILPFLGFQISVFLFLIYHLRIRAKRPWWFSLLASLGGSLGTYYAFVYGLKVYLPTAVIPGISSIGL